MNVYNSKCCGLNVSMNDCVEGVGNLLYLVMGCRVLDEVLKYLLNECMWREFLQRTV